MDQILAISLESEFFNLCGKKGDKIKPKILILSILNLMHKLYSFEVM